MIDKCMIPQSDTGWKKCQKYQQRWRYYPIRTENSFFTEGLDLHTLDFDISSWISGIGLLTGAEGS